MRHVKKYDFGEWMMYSHLPEIRSERTNRMGVWTMAIVGLAMLALELTGAADVIRSYII